MSSLQFSVSRPISPAVYPHRHRRVKACANVEVHTPNSLKKAVGVSREVMEAEGRVLVGTYARAPAVFSSGKGCKLYDSEEREYLDLSSGIGVNALGHGDPDWVRAVTEQAGMLTHVSNACYSIPQVQCGLGRTGYLWSHEAYHGIVPDIMTLAKPLAGGLPIEAVLVTERVAAAIRYGDHGSTFAGGPLVCTAALAVLEKVSRPGFLASVSNKGQCFKELLIRKVGGNSHVRVVRGLGLIIGIELDVSASPLVDACRNSGLLVLTAGKGNVIRLLPPLIITKQELEHAAGILLGGIPARDKGNRNYENVDLSVELHVRIVM